MADSLTFDSAYRALKREAPAAVYCLAGDEEVLKQELLDVIIAGTVDRASRDFNVDIRAAGDLNGETVHTLVETPPMLADRRVVVIKNLEQWRKNAKVWQVLDSYLDHPSPSTVLVLVLGAGESPRPDVARRAVHVRVDSLNPARLRRWVSVRAEGAGLQLTEEAAEHLLRASGSDMSALAVEIEKLAAAAPAGETLGIDLVAELVGVRRGETVHDWTDAVLLREIPRAIGMLDAVLSTAGVSGVKMVSALGVGLLGLRIARAAADRGVAQSRIAGVLFGGLRAARPWGLRDWKLEAALWARAAGAWSARDIDEALRAAYEADRALKSTTVSGERGTLTRMLLHMARFREAA